MNETRAALPDGWTLSSSDDLIENPEILRHNGRAVGTIGFSPEFPVPEGPGRDSFRIAERFVWTAGTDEDGAQKGAEADYEDAVKAMLDAMLWRAV